MGAGVDGEDAPFLPGSVRWLRDKDGLRRVRFALLLAPGEHVVGLGERFDAVDQRGRRPDVDLRPVAGAARRRS